MSATTGIAWTNASWNPLRGCERVSEGCKHCYAEILAARHSYPGGWGEGIAKWVTRPDGAKEARWTGVIRTVPELLDAPLRWRKPRRIFVNSMSDLFHSDVPESLIDAVFRVMIQARQHVYQILTKRPERMFAYLSRFRPDGEGWVTRDGARAMGEPQSGPLFAENRWPPPQIWLGVSVEDQPTADERIPLLLQTSAAKRLLSYEPALAAVDFQRWLCIRRSTGLSEWVRDGERNGLDWIIVGGESGHARREMNIDHARSVIAQCRSAGVPIYVKQDSGPRPGMQGRFTDEEWALKEFPA